MRILIAALIALAAGGCLATTEGARKIKSKPSGALVTIEGYGECETPCTVRLNGQRNVIVAKAGYKAQRFAIAPEGPTIKVELELAAPTDEVDAEALPELE